jgi:hypothetical protein
MQNPITLVSENKTLSALWAVFLPAFCFTVQHWYTGDEEIASIRTLSTAIEEQRGEFERAKTALELHDNVITELDESNKKFGTSLQPKDLSREKFAATTKTLIDRSLSSRHILGNFRGIISGYYFEMSALKELQAGLLKDFDQLDDFLRKREDLLRLMLTNPRKAKQLGPTLLIENADGERTMLEAEMRNATYAYILKKARREHNDKVAEGNAQLKMFRMRSNLAIASVSYMAGFIGALIGWLDSRRRRRAKKKAGGEESTSAASGS